MLSEPGRQPAFQPAFCDPLLGGAPGSVESLALGLTFLPASIQKDLGSAGIRAACLWGWLYYDYNDSRGRMPTSVRLDPDVEARLENLARVNGRSKAFYLRELIEHGLDDLEDAYLGAAALEAHRRSGEAGIPLAEVMEDLCLEG